MQSQWLTHEKLLKAQSPTSSLTKLDLSGSKVADLTSLPRLTNLQTLTLPAAPSSAVMPEADSQAQAYGHCRAQRWSVGLPIAILQSHDLSHWLLLAFSA